MSTLAVYVGLDYHKDTVQVCVLDSDGHQLGNRRCANDVVGVMRFAEQHGTVQRAAIESCPGAADFAEELLQNDWSVDLAHPGYVARMKQNPDKSDYTDARMLADLTRVGYLPKVWLAPHPVRELRRLVRFRQQLVNERRAIKLRITATLREQRIEEPEKPGRWTKGWFDWMRARAELTPASRWVVEQQLIRLESLRNEIAAVMRQLKRATSDDVIVERLLELPGIGLVTAYVLRAEIGHFGRFATGKQLSRFCGLSPRNASSGNRQADAGLIKQANPTLRAVIIEAAHRLKRHDPRWRAFAKRLHDAGKPGSVIAAAVGNRWVRWLYHRLNDVANNSSTTTTAV
jgi:transposase